jgi:hypothetical protein
MTRPAFEPGPPQWEAGNRLSYGAAMGFSYCTSNQLKILRVLIPSVGLHIHIALKTLFCICHDEQYYFVFAMIHNRSMKVSVQELV